MIRLCDMHNINCSIYEPLYYDTNMNEVPIVLIEHDIIDDYEIYVDGIWANGDRLAIQLDYIPELDEFENFIFKMQDEQFNYREVNEIIDYLLNYNCEIVEYIDGVLVDSYILDFNGITIKFMENYVNEWSSNLICKIEN